MFKYVISVYPLGLMYGSAGGFLSPENLVGRARAKFPPEAATLSGLFFSANKISPFTTQEELRTNLYLAGPFWAKETHQENFYIPIPWLKIIGEKERDEWSILDDKWQRKNNELEPDFTWQPLNLWNCPLKTIQECAVSSPWKFVSILHPKIKHTERHVVEEDGLFLEYAVQMPDDTCLIYLSTHQLPDGWYRFGGENHLVEIKSVALKDEHPLQELLRQPIKRSFALITPGVWGSNRLSFRYPQQPDFPVPEKMLTDKPLPYRYRAGGRMGRGRYAVSAGTVYVLPKALDKPWWDWPEEWFPKEGYSLKRVGCGLCLPIKIEGVN